MVLRFWEERAHALLWQADLAMNRGLPLLAAELQEKGLQILLRVQAERTG